MSDRNQNKKKTGGLDRSRKESKTTKLKGSRETGDFRIGSRDILATPEILPPLGFEEETPKSRRGRKSPVTSVEEKPAAPTHNRKGKKKAEEPAPVKQEAKAGRAKADKSADKKSADSKKSAKAEAPKKTEAPVEVSPKKTPSKSRRGGASIVSADDSIVVAADTVAAETPKTAPRKSSASALRGMREKCDNALIAAIGIPTRYNRVPYGLYPQMIKAKTGWAHIQWSVDTYDWRGKSAKAVLTTVKKEIHDGAIILCHDIKDNTPEAAKLVCNWLQENGYMLLTIDELFAKDGVVLEGDQVYFRCEDGETTIKKK